MAATITSAAQQKRTWADIVTGSEASARRSVKPAKRGERRCFCQGEILVMLGHYGWILAMREIDHDDSAKTGGRVYVHQDDIDDHAVLRQGDIVSFYLYADDQGLGAEGCHLETLASLDATDCDDATSQPLSTGQQRYVDMYNHFTFDIGKPNLQHDSSEFVPFGELAGSCWNPGAADFTPSGFNVQAAEFVPSSFSGASHEAAWGAASCFPSTNAHQQCAINMAFFADDDSDTDDDDATSVQSHLCGKSPRTSSVDGSTSAGSSDSDSDDVEHVHPKLPAGFRPPPGLSLEGWRPPPGLELPVDAF